MKETYTANEQPNSASPGAGAGDYEKNKAAIIAELDGAIVRLKKRIEALHLEANNPIINPFAMRLVATSPDGRYFVAVKGATESAVGFQFAPLARVTQIRNFREDEESYVEKFSEEFAKKPVAEQLTGFKLVTLREFSGEVEKILKDSLDETQKLCERIRNDEHRNESNTAVQSEQGSV